MSGGRGEAGRGAPDGTNVEAYSLLGEPLYAPELPAERRARLEADLDQARIRFEADPRDEERIIWLGRRLAYLGRYREAVDVFTAGLREHPRSYRLLRHRGHRLITLRRLDDAIRDLDRAARIVRDLPDEVEPDGAPNARNIPRSTTNSNITYHLGLAHYLARDFEAAARAYRACMPFARVNDDMLSATTYWLYMTLRRLGLDDEASAALSPIGDEMEIMENAAYHRLLLMYQGKLAPEVLLREARGDGIDLATIGTGVGTWRLWNGEVEEARRIFGEVVDEAPWAAFGRIAAEAELAAGLK